VKNEEFAKLVADALEVAAQAHPVRIEYDRLMGESVIHVLDRDQVLWRVQVANPR
jgi:hypothetical protein